MKWYYILTHIHNESHLFSNITHTKREIILIKSLIIVILREKKELII